LDDEQVLPARVFDDAAGAHPLDRDPLGRHPRFHECRRADAPAGALLESRFAFRQVPGECTQDLVPSAQDAIVAIQLDVVGVAVHQCVQVATVESGEPGADDVERRERHATPITLTTTRLRRCPSNSA
jgi:hypothetical protein